MPATMKASVTDGPARSALAAAVRTKRPAPMMAPIPSPTSDHGPSVRLSPVSPELSAMRPSIDLVRNNEPATIVPFGCLCVRPGRATPRGVIGARMEEAPAKLRPVAGCVKKADGADYLSRMPAPESSITHAAASEVATLIHPGTRIASRPTSNPDGDGLGSEVAMVYLLRALGATVSITNPTPTPARFGFLLADIPDVDRSSQAVKELRRADLIIVLDIADLSRLGALGDTERERGVPVVCIDHHASPGTLPAGPRFVDVTAAATGELIFMLAQLLRLAGHASHCARTVRGARDGHGWLPFLEYPTADAARCRRAARSGRRS